MHRTREGEAHLSLLTQTILVQALAHAALAKGYTIRFTTLVAGLADLSRQESVRVLERGLRRYTRVELLALDEFGYLPAFSRSADLL